MFQLAAHIEQFLETENNTAGMINSSKFTKCINIWLECVRVVIAHFYYFRSHPQYTARRLLRNTPEWRTKYNWPTDAVTCLYCWPEPDHRDLTVAKPKSPIFTVKLSSCRNILFDFRSLKGWTQLLTIKELKLTNCIYLWIIFLACK